MTDSAKQFTDARLKAKRANRHIYDLVEQYRAFVNSDSGRLVVENDSQTGHKRIKMQEVENFPPAIPFIIGDAVHNLRTAFDYIVVEMTGEERRALPVGKTMDELIGTRQYREIQASHPHIAAFISDEIQPYLRGKFSLWELAELDRIDKHRLILPTFNQAHRVGVVLEDQSGNRLIRSQFTAGPGYTIFQVHAGHFEVKDEGQAALSVSFGPGTPFEGESVIATLSVLAERAILAIEAFESFHFRKP